MKSKRMPHIHYTKKLEIIVITQKNLQEQLIVFAI